MNNIKTLTVYLGSSGHARPVFQDAARDLGRDIAAHNHHLVYGGMDAGLMGELARECLNAGGHVTGIIPRKIKDSERILTGLSETVLVEELWERKRRMFERADAVISLPGGFGTLDESLEVLYWGALALHNKPLVLINIEQYWTPFIDYVKTLPDFDPRYLIVVENTGDVFSALQQWRAPPEPPKKPESYPHFEDSISRATDHPIIIDKASIENSYYLICALGLKQLGKHKRHIGLLNTGGQFDHLIQWFKQAQREHFITDKCLGLFDAAPGMDALTALLDAQKDVNIDLHTEKWGERRKKPRD